MMKFNYNDGGRQKAGYTGIAGDCVARAIAIATGRPYEEIYDFLAKGRGTQIVSKKQRQKIKDDWAARGLPFEGKEYKDYVKRRTKTCTASRGIDVTRKWFKDYMKSLGFDWVSTMQIGVGCRVHLREDELPSSGRLVVNVSKHFTAVIDGVLNDIYDCSRGGNRCVYGYYILK